MRAFFTILFAMFIVMAAVIVECVLTLLELSLAVVEYAVDSYHLVKTKFNKTSKKLKNMFFSRYELSFKQETLFKVGIKTDRDNFPKYSYMIGTLRRGSFDFELEPIKYDQTTLIEKIELKHMGRSGKTIYGPLYMQPGDTVKLIYGSHLYPL